MVRSYGSVEAGLAKMRKALSEPDTPSATFSTAQSVDPWDRADDSGDDDSEAAPPFSWRKLWMFSGPGLLMSMAYLDPGNLEADLQAGATSRYELLWVLFWATVMGLLLQNLAAKLGVVSGKHLAQHCREYPTPVRYFLWVMTEVALIGADCQEVVGSAIAINILSDGSIPLWCGCLLTAVSCFLFMFLDSSGVRKLEALFAVLIAVMVAAFGFQFLSRPPAIGDVVSGLLVPRVSGADNFQTAAGLIGAVIMPHNIFLHSALVLSRKVDRDFDRNPGRATRQVGEAVFYNRIESAAALGVSFLINMCVVGVFANVRYFRANGSPVCSFQGKPVCPGLEVDPAGCGGIGLLSAGSCLRQSYAEPWWLYVWAVGVLAAGQASTISGTYAGQFIMTGFLDLRISMFQRTVFSRAFALGPALLFALAAPGNPTLMDALNEGINVLQAVQIPFAMFPVLYFSVSTSHCRGGFATRGMALLVCWTVVMLVLAANGITLAGTFNDLPTGWLWRAGLCALTGAYCCTLVYLLLTSAGLITLHGKLPQ